MTGTPDWAAHAACHGQPVDLFYPLVGHSPARYYAQVEQAAAYCARCPVIHQCALAAAGEKDGVWAGRDRTVGSRPAQARRGAAA